MKRATITLDHDELDAMVREQVIAMFPELEVETITGLGYGEVTIRLRKPAAPIIPPDTTSL